MAARFAGIFFLTFIIAAPITAQDLAPDVGKQQAEPPPSVETRQADKPPEIAQDSSDHSSSASAQNGTENEEKKKENPAAPEAHGARLEWKHLPKNILQDQKEIWTSPFHINRDNAKWWALFVAGSGALIATDKKFNQHLPNSNTQIGVSTWASRLGADYTLYPLAALFYFYGKPADNPRARDTARLGIEALADAEIAVNVLKTVTQRPRPETKDTNISFWRGGDSFPSGHSIQTFALARVIALEFNQNRAIPILTYGLASIVPIARVAGRRHSPSDAFVGSVMGFFIGDYVYRHHHAPSKKSAALLWVADHVSIELGNR
jgi:membrane-associated phospholipid phosphatase